jgi:Golgi SNAP receptor complex protein 1
LYTQLGKLTALATKQAKQESQRSSSSSSSSTSATPSSRRHRNSGDKSSSTTANKNVDVTEIAAVEKQIDQLFATFHTLIDALADNIATSSSLQTSTNTSLLQRSRSILSDYEREYTRTRQKMRRARTRNELLLDVRGDDDAAVASRTESLLREHSSLRNSMALTDRLIAQADASHTSLKGQARRLGGTFGKLGKVAAKMPLLNSLMGAIGRKKNKDMVVMAVVIASLLCFTFWYIVH